MIARKCDRCNKHYDHYRKKEEYNSVMKIQTNQSNDNYNCGRKYDLCQQCKEEFEKWLILEQEGKVCS